MLEGSHPRNATPKCATSNMACPCPIRMRHVDTAQKPVIQEGQTPVLSTAPIPTVGFKIGRETPLLDSVLQFSARFVSTRELGGRQAGRPGVTFFSDFLQFVGGNKSLSGSQTPRAFGATRCHCTCKVLITRLSIDLTVNQGRRSNKFKEVL